MNRQTQAAPRQAEILSVGDELLAGSFVDLNASMLARRLRALGIEVGRFSAVGDDRQAMAQALREAAGRCKLLLVTGGLGPTEDDLTRHAAADASGKELYFDEPAWEAIRADYVRRGRRFGESNKLSAMFPRGAKILPNGAGTAPGFRLTIGECALYFLPGPPFEAERMFDHHIAPELAASSLTRAVFVEKRLHLFGITESEFGEKVRERMARGRNPRVGDTVRKGVISVHIHASGASEAEARALADREAAEIRALFPRFLFGEDGKSLPESVLEILREKKLRLATAESCTGGLVAKLLTDIPGASEIFAGGVVAYSNALKEKLLGVPHVLLETHGAVSQEVAAAMAQGAAQLAGAEVGIGVTGIAGPQGGSEEKPVGLVYEAIFFAGKASVEKHIYPPGDRKRVRELSARAVLQHVRWRLLADQVQPGPLEHF